MKERAFEQLATSIREAGAFRRGEKTARVTAFKPDDVRIIQSKLAEASWGNRSRSLPKIVVTIGVSVGTLRNWEQGRRVPEGPALALLKVASRNPRAVKAALHGVRGV